ncbi:hypothetical protein BFN03_16175 [Rhodococcus sp. WMMA185]|uniref:DUF2752 domain-containing protein n=1 Tax=Rhodococcus sp. WMMA185 TaxID=679318 RepID=UPI00087854D1|nr:DUF2752 domain-containing protein [Rhodococcus sp. WMMA185]AOW93665.1 hypothetical protein BFN03_16175 [Rhodococcus sp. WMMA185]
MQDSQVDPATARQGVRRLGAPVAVAATIFTVCGFVAWADPTTPGGVIPVCPTKALLGINCPGCGSTRMLYSLLHLDIANALRYNAVGVAALVLLGAAYLTWTRGRLRGRKIRGWQHLPWAPAVALTVTVAWFVVRNIPFEPFTGLRV